MITESVIVFHSSSSSSFSSSSSSIFFIFLVINPILQLLDSSHGMRASDFFGDMMGVILGFFLPKFNEISSKNWVISCQLSVLILLTSAILGVLFSNRALVLEFLWLIIANFCREAIELPHDIRGESAIEVVDMDMQIREDTLTVLKENLEKAQAKMKS